MLNHIHVRLSDNRIIDVQDKPGLVVMEGDTPLTVWVEANVGREDALRAGRFDPDAKVVIPAQRLVIPPNPRDVKIASLEARLKSLEEAATRPSAR